MGQKFTKIRTYKKDNHNYWLVDVRSKKLGLNIRKSFNFKNQAVDYARELENQILEKGNRVSENLVYTNPEIDKLTSRLQSRGKTIQDAVEFYFKSLDLELKQSLVPPIKELSEKWYTEKKDSTLRPISKRTKIELNCYRKFIQHHFGQSKPAEVTSKQIEIVLSASGGINATKLHRWKKIRQFFNWCIKNKFISSNPTDGIEILVEQKEIQIWEPNLISQVLTHVEENYPSLLGYYVLCVFAGLRPSEAEKILWKDIDFEIKEIFVKYPGKTGSRRVILKETTNKETDTLWFWLNHFKKMNPKGTFNPTKNHQGLQVDVRESLPFDWSQDVLRHSFGTYYQNVIHDLPRVAHDMGNSVTVCNRHYVREVK
ncbi:MAG: site-specific integrase, partial [Mariniphaga sp.]